MDQTLATALRQLPSVDEVLADPALTPALAELDRELVVDAIRTAIDEARCALRGGHAVPTDAAAIAVNALARLDALRQPSLRPVVNATGVIVHTNLGRAPLADEAIEAVVAAARGYSTLEYDLERQTRGSRQDLCTRLLTTLTGAEAALVVNNNAGAVMLVLSELARGRDVVVSRGELIEIGGSFRIPDIMAAAGPRMVEVGTTNKTHPRDFEAAITDDTAMLLKVHPSNYAIVGFTETVDAATLATIAERENERRRTAGGADNPLYVYEDLGSGSVLNLEQYGFPEPSAADALAAGCDVVSFSGDKLLGGPQAGVVIGKREPIERLRTSPLMRVLRPDKMTLAALEATLTLYLEPATAQATVPVLRLMTEPAETVRERAEALSAALAGRISATAIGVDVIETASCTGGGAMPLVDIPSYGVALTFSRGSAEDCQRHLLRQSPTPVVARIHEERLIFDCRTLLFDDEITTIATAVGDYVATL